MVCVLIAALQGCIMSPTDEPEEVVTPNQRPTQYTLRLAIVNQNGTMASRASGHTPHEQGTDAENYIDVMNRDYLVVIYTSSGEYVTTLDQSMLRVTTQPASPYNTYIVEGVVDKSVAEESLKSNFKVMVVSNLRGFNVVNPDFSRTTYLSDLWINKTGYNFEYSFVNGNSWTPSITDRRLIPMFGIADVDGFEGKTEDNLGNIYTTTTIPMLRAVAKVEILSTTTFDNGYTMDGATLSHYNEKGRLIPDVAKNPSWNISDTQVVSTSLPEGGDAPKGGIVTFVKEGSKLVAYIPEMALTGDTGDNNRPHVMLHVKGKTDPNFDYHFRLEFCEYTQQNGKYQPDKNNLFDEILRNHIYRFEINDVTKYGLILQIGICPWGSETISIPEFD